MQLDKFEAVMIGLMVGNLPPRTPADWKTAVNVLDKLLIPEEELAKYDGVPWGVVVGLTGQEGMEVDLTADEMKFTARHMVTHATRNPQFGARMLKPLMGLWEKLYANWEEFGQK